MYKDILYKEYKRRNIAALRFIIIFHIIIAISVLVDYFTTKDIYTSWYITMYILYICIIIFACYEDFLKMKAIAQNKYRAITVSCYRKDFSLRRGKTGFFCYYTYKYEVCKARLTFRHYKVIKKEDRVLLLSFGGSSLILQDDVIPLPSLDKLNNT